MAVIIKRIKLWRTEAENRPGALAHILEPLAKAGADVQLLMGYRLSSDESKVAIELSPITGKKLTVAAGAAGLSASPIPSLVVQGDNKPGLLHGIARGLAEARINISFATGNVIGRRFAVVFGFDSETDAKQAPAVIRKATAPGRR